MTELYIIQSMRNGMPYWCPKSENYVFNPSRVKKPMGKKELLEYMKNSEKLPKGDYLLHTILRKQ